MLIHELDLGVTELHLEEIRFEDYLPLSFELSLTMASLDLNTY